MSEGPIDVEPGAPKGGTQLATARHFDSIAGEYDESIPAHVRDHYLKRRLGWVLALCSPGDPVLEVGSGTGVLGVQLAEAGVAPVGLDISMEILRVAKKRQATCLAQAEGPSLPFRPGRFALVFCVATLHHVAEPELVARTIAEMVRVARAGGTVLIIDHNPNNPYWTLLMRRVPQDCGDERLVPLAEILAAARSAGITDIRYRRTGFVPDFMPSWLLPAWRLMERFVEATPGLRLLCAHNSVILRKGQVDVGQG